MPQRLEAAKAKWSSVPISLQRQFGWLKLLAWLELRSKRNEMA
jgi:hypothetical protein